MVTTPYDVDRYIVNMLNNFRNKSHKKDAEEYLFIRERIDKVNNYTRRNDVQALLSLDFFLKGKSYEKATQDDILAFEQYLEKEYVSPGKKERYEKTIKAGNEAIRPKVGLDSGSVEQYEAHIKRFYKYLSNKNEYKKGKRFQKNIPYPNSVSWISASSQNSKEFPIDKLLKEEELLKLLNMCDNTRDKAMISAGFYDAGLRIGELISLNIRSVGFDKLGGYFILPKKGENLKTGVRRIRLFIMPSSTKYLKDFINNHPFKKYEDAPLFFTQNYSTFNKIINKINNNTFKKDDFEEVRLSRPGIENKIKKYCNLAGISVLTPHQLRHNSATLSCKAGFNEAQMRLRYGWSKTSKMPSRYTHLVSADLDEKIKQITGFKEPDKPLKSKLESIICWNCNDENVPTNKFCSMCGSNLNPKKEEITPTAAETGIALQKSMNQDEMYQLMFKKLQDMEKELKKLKNK